MPTAQRSITFGSNHRGYTTFPPATPDGWLVVEAPNEELLESLILGIFFDPETYLLKYAFDYPGAEPSSPELYPLGRIATLSLTLENR